MCKYIDPEKFASSLPSQRKTETSKVIRVNIVKTPQDR